MTERKSYTVYSKKEGVEFRIGTCTRSKNGYEVRQGCLYIRGFSYEEGKESQITMRLSLVEVHKLSRILRAILKADKNKYPVAIHKVNNGETKSETTKVLEVERWNREGRNGIAVVITQKENEQIIRRNIPMDQDTALALSTLLTLWMPEIAIEIVKVLDVLPEENEDELPVGEETPEDDFPF